MEERKVIHTASAPSSKSPLSQAIQLGSLLFVSGTVPVDPVSGTFVGGDVKNQTRCVLENIKAILDAGGSSMTEVLKVTAYLTNIESRHDFNQVYEEYFPKDPPARSTFEVGALAEKYEVEIEVIARAR